jgi:nicotinate-nucleotide adenylyltransferase
MKRLAFYGGSFNPCHIGHQATVLHALECANIEGLMVAPAYKHPDGKQLVDFDDRVNMCWEMVRPLKADHCPVWVDRVEYSNWAQNGTCYTLDAIKLVLNLHRPETLVLILGSDIKPVFENWVGIEGIASLMAAGRVEVFWVERVGDLSSTLVRCAIKTGASTQRMLPARIRQTIDEKGWYR